MKELKSSFKTVSYMAIDGFNNFTVMLARNPSDVKQQEGGLDEMLKKWNMGSNKHLWLKEFKMENYYLRFMEV